MKDGVFDAVMLYRAVEMKRSSSDLKGLGRGRAADSWVVERWPLPRSSLSESRDEFKVLQVLRWGEFFFIGNGTGHFKMLYERIMSLVRRTKKVVMFTLGEWPTWQWKCQQWLRWETGRTRWRTSLELIDLTEVVVWHLLQESVPSRKMLPPPLA